MRLVADRSVFREPKVRELRIVLLMMNIAKYSEKKKTEATTEQRKMFGV
jgi:hypothetical protein